MFFKLICQSPLKCGNFTALSTSIFRKKQPVTAWISCYHTGPGPVKMAYSSYEMAPSNGSTISGEPLIIMHGLFGSKNNWNSLSKAIHMKCKKKVVAVDARNHGDSPHSSEFSYEHLAADIHYLMEELHIEKANLMGHSMGGRAVMAFSLSYPELVKSAVIVDISPVNSSVNMLKMSSFFEAMKSVRLEKNLSMSQARKSADDQLSKWISDLSIRQFLITNLTQIDGGRFKWRVNLDVLANKFETTIANFPQISGICDSPCLFIGGLKSDYLRFEHHDVIKTLFPRAEFQYLDTGHWVHAERPTEFIETLCDFFSRNNV